MSITKIGAALGAGLLFVVCAQAPANAASIATNVFLDNLVPNVDFLDQSSRTALDNTKNARLRDFAHAEAADQTLAANALYAWIEADKKLIAAADAAGSLQTGRSVAIDNAQLVDNRLPLGQEDIDQIYGLTGAEFDDQFKQKQHDALTQIQKDYRDYIAKGDDPVLLKLAKSQLPKVDKKLAELGKL